MKHCKEHDIWYSYNESCPECGKFMRIAGDVIGNVIGAGIIGVITAGKKVNEHYKEQKKLDPTKNPATNIKQETRRETRREREMREMQEKKEGVSSFWWSLIWIVTIVLILLVANAS